MLTGFFCFAQLFLNDVVEWGDGQLTKKEVAKN